MKRFSILILVAMLALACFAPAFVSAQPYVHGWMTKTLAGTAVSALKPYRTTTVWAASPFAIPKDASGKGTIYLTATDMDINGSADTIYKPQVLCKLLGPDGVIVYTDSANAGFSITNVDTVSKVVSTTMSYVIPFDFTRYGNIAGFLVGFKGLIADDSVAMTVDGIRY